MALDVSRRSIFYWLKRYKRSGVEGFRERHHSGKPTGFVREQMYRLADILDSGPMVYGFTSGV